MKCCLKWILSLVIFLSSNEIYAKANLLLQCLAKEEEKLHKSHDQSTLYRLNQSFLNELASNNDISIKKNFVDEICNDKTTSPSIGFLRLLLLKESDIYDLSLSESDPSIRPFKMGHINEFQKQVPHLLVSYLMGLQSEISDAHCLNQAIPEFVDLTEKLKYLEEEISIHRIVSDKKKIEVIFKKLKNFPAIKKDCDLKAENKLKLTMKKNEKARAGK